MLSTTQSLTLPAFGDLLIEGRETSVAELKAMPLLAEAIQDLAEILAFTVGVSYLGSNRADIRSALGESKAPAILPADSALANLEASWLVQSLARNSKGELALDPESKLPIAELNTAKLGQFLAAGNARKLIEDKDLADESELKAVTEALSSRATHLIKLSVDAGKARPDAWGGWLKTARVVTDAAFEASVNEQDFLTRSTRALTCSAGYQAKDWLAQTTVIYQGTQATFVDLLRDDPALRAELLACWQSWGTVRGAEALMAAIAAYLPPTFSGEPQLFCGEGATTAVVAPLTPFALPMELLRARRSLQKMHDQDMERSAQAIDEDAQRLQAVIDALTAADAKSFPGGKPARTAALKDAKTSLAAATEAANRVRKSCLSIPTFTLPIGGANPRNVACGLSLALHGAPIFTRVREREVRAAIGNKVYFTRSLLTTPHINADKVPPAFTTASKGAAGRNARRALFSAWALEALEPLLELKDAVALDDAEEPNALYAEALAHLRGDSSCKAVFAKGSSVSGNAAEELFAPLIRELCECVKSALRTAFKDVVFNEFDAELREVATAVVLRERA